MKKTYLILITLFTLNSYSQAELSPGTKPTEAHKSVRDGYTTDLGWEIKPGDTIQLGTGNRDRQWFSYIYSSPASWSQMINAMDPNSPQDPLKFLSGDYNNMIAIVKKFGVQGNKRIGYFAYAVVGIGEMENYWIDLENAVIHGEIIPSDPMYAPKKEAMEVKVVGQVSDKYDQLAKLKNLLDEGIITQEEYDAEKQKILNKE